MSLSLTGIDLGLKPIQIGSVQSRITELCLNDVATVGMKLEGFHLRLLSVKYSKNVVFGDDCLQNLSSIDSNEIKVITRAS